MSKSNNTDNSAKAKQAAMTYASRHTADGGSLLFQSKHGWHGGARLMAAAIIGHGA